MSKKSKLRSFLFGTAFVASVAIGVAGYYMYTENKKKELQVEEQLLLYKAEEYLLMEDLDNCLHVLNTILDRINPHSYEAQRLKTLSFINGEQVPEEAQKALALATTLKDKLRIEILLEMLYLQQYGLYTGDVTRTKDLLMRLASAMEHQYPNDEDLLVERAALYAMVGRADKVREDCEKVLGMGVSKGFVFAKAAYLYSFTFDTDFKKRLQYLSKAIDFQRSFVGALYERAQIYARYMKQSDSAMADLNRMLGTLCWQILINFFSYTSKT